MGLLAYVVECQKNELAQVNYSTLRFQFEG